MLVTLIEKVDYLTKLVYATQQSQQQPQQHQQESQSKSSPSDRMIIAMLEGLTNKMDYAIKLLNENEKQWEGKARIFLRLIDIITKDRDLWIWEDTAD
jgi:hypothetical protein